MACSISSSTPKSPVSGCCNCMLLACASRRWRSAFSIAGGGDTLAAIEKYGVRDRLSYISTAGGAFLEFVEGKALPAVTALAARAAD